MSKLVELWNRYVLNRQPVQEQAPEPYVGPDDLADKLAEEANDLFRAVQEKREQAAQILTNAAEEARSQAANLQKRAEAALQLAAERASKADQSSRIARKLNEFIS